MPIVFRFLINKKSILYKRENIITINNLSYRLKKNFTTYATIGILTASTVTVLGTSAVSYTHLIQTQYLVLLIHMVDMHMVISRKLLLGT